MRIENLEKLLVEELKDIYDAEHQLVDALEEMARSAGSSQLKQAFSEHRQQTKGQIERLERVFHGLGEPAERKTCKGIKGLLEEGKELISADGDKAAVDAALIGAAQKVEHYEMAAYGTLRTFAATLGRRAEAQLLQETLDEESAADEKLSDLAVSEINPEAREGNGQPAAAARRGGLAGLLRSLGIRSSRPEPAAARSTAGRKGGARKTAATKTRATGATKKGAAKRGATKSGATKSGATKRGATKSGATKPAGARRSAARKTGAKTGPAKSGGGRKSTAAKATARRTAGRQATRGGASKSRSGSRKGR